MAIKTCIKQKYAIYDLKQNISQKCKFGYDHKIFVEQFTRK